MYTQDQLSELEEGWFFYDHAWQLLHHIISKIKGSSLLDVGCGTGMALALIKAAKPFITVSGIEPSEQAKNIWKQRNLNVEVGSATSLPYDDNLFDTVICSHVIEHIDDHAAALNEIIRVSKKRAIIVVPSGNVDEKNPGTPHVRYYNRINFKELIATASTDFITYSLPHYHMNNLVAVIDKE